MKLNIKYLGTLVLAFGLILTSCADLDVENLNNADIQRVLANPADYEGVVSGQFNNLMQSTQLWRSATSFTFGTMADANSSSWGNFAMRDMSSEPRIPWNNSETYSYAYSIEDMWYRNYSVIGSANDILRLVKDGAMVPDANGDDITQKIVSTGRFAVGVAYGNLALAYDKAKFIDENVALVDIPNTEFSDYKTLTAQAIATLESAITAANAAPDFNMGYFNGVSLSKADYIKLIRTYQARFLAYSARTDAENAATDWTAVWNYAAAGITADFAPIGDGNAWWDAYKYYASNPGWARADNRIIAAMTPDVPSRFPTDNSHPFPAHTTATDARLDTDFTYSEGIPFRANRGLYHFGHYQSSRYAYHTPGGTGPMPQALVAENDLLKAEALIRTGGSKADAAAFINVSRVGRGGMAALTGAESDADMLDAVMHERYVELHNSWAGIPFYDRRRSADDANFGPYTGLQPGTPHQMPIPAKELNVLGLEIYTY